MAEFVEAVNNLSGWGLFVIVVVLLCLGLIIPSLNIKTSRKIKKGEGD